MDNELTTLRLRLLRARYLMRHDPEAIHWFEALQRLIDAKTAHHYTWRRTTFGRMRKVRPPEAATWPTFE